MMPLNPNVPTPSTYVCMYVYYISLSLSFPLFLSGEPPALMALCGLSIHVSMGKERETQTDRLPLPPPLQRYILPSM